MASQRDAGARFTDPRSLARVLAAIQRAGLSATEFRVLAMLAEERCALIELADRVDLPASTVRSASRQLAMRGLIRRRQGSRRNSWVSITTSGQTMLRRLTASASQPAQDVTTSEAVGTVLEATY